MKYKLTKLSDNENNLRTKEAIGYSHNPPKQGDSFAMVGDPLETEIGQRVITTSIIITIEDMLDNKQIFHTLNSTYSLESIPE